MSCIQTFKGIDLSCADATGGIKEVYITNFDNVSSVAVGPAGTIDTITMSEDLAKFIPYRFRKQTGSMTSTVNNDDAAGTSFVQTDVVLQFTKLETGKRLEITALITGNCAMIVKDGNNKYWFLGHDNPITFTSGTGATGTAFGDFNGYNITLSDFSKELPYEVTEEAVKLVVGDIAE